jgi:hypothetical protein
MILNKYSKFKSLNENVQQAKVYMKNRYLANKRNTLKSSNPDTTDDQIKGIGLDAREQRAAETDPLFQKIKNTITSNDNYTFLMTKIFFEDMNGDDEQLPELDSLYKEIKSGGLPRNIEMYVNPDKFLKGKISEKEFNDFTLRGDGSKKTISEMITDDLGRSKSDQSYKQFTDEFPTRQKNQLNTATKQQIDKLKRISDEFTRMGVDDDGNFDPALNRIYKRDFFSKLKDYTTIDQIIDGALAKIKSANNGKFGIFVKQIDRVNNQLGEANGARVVYEKEGVVVIEVLSYVANKELNSHTIHCIARSIGHWENYLRDFNRQYYMYNFNLEETDNYSVIGMTMTPEGSFSAAHLKNDENCLSRVKSLISNNGVPISVFEPMSKQDMEQKKRKIEASKKIVDPSLNFEKLKQCLEEGADPNAKRGLPLKNMVKSNNIEAVKYLLEKGAMPNLADSDADKPINSAESLKMIKLLVEYGATITNAVFKGVKDDLSAVEYLLEAGMDPSFDFGYPFRWAAKMGNVEMMELLLKYADNIPNPDGEKLTLDQKQLALIKERRQMAIKWACESGETESVKLIFDKMRSLGDEAFKTPDNLESFKKVLINFIETSDKISQEDSIELVEFVKSYETTNESMRFLRFKSFI